MDAPDPLAPFAAGLTQLEATPGDTRATLARYLALVAEAGLPGLPAEARGRFFRLNLAWLAGVFERGQAAGEVGLRLVPEASAMVLLARLEAGRDPGPALLHGLMD